MLLPLRTEGPVVVALLPLLALIVVLLIVLVLLLDAFLAVLQ